MANETTLFLRAEAGDKKFDEFSMVIPTKEFTEQDWELFKQLLPKAFESMASMHEQDKTEEKATLTADMEVVKAAE